MGLTGKTAILLGATGLTGTFLTHILLGDHRYVKVKSFSRSPIGFSHPKLEEYLVDVLELKNNEGDFIGDEVFCCVGTTKDKTPNKNAYKKIDYGIPVSAARLCKDKNMKTFIVISSLGADAKSPVFYNRTKGEMEEEVIGLQVAKTHILRPSLISGSRKERRVGEWLAKQMMKAVDPLLLGSLKKYRSIGPNAIAKSMVWLANTDYEHVYVESDQIHRISEKALGDD
ncbi:MAG: nucleoside-diphosphate sugar epimerase [Bacteroidota bacterium]